MITSMQQAPHPRVGVGVLLTDSQGRVLLTLRKLPPEAGCSSIVGGKVDFLETLEQCAIREPRKEVGVEISLRALLCVSRVKPARSAGSASTSCLRISP